jgi:hypothetical protein
MRKRLLVFVLLGALVSFGPSLANAQISTTGPAGLARQMPQIYGPYMANRSRILYHQKHKHRQHRRHQHGHRTRRAAR